MMTSISFDQKIGWVLLLLSFTCSSCFTPHTAFNGAHDFKNIKSSVELAGNKELNGYLSFSHGSSNAILHVTEDGKTVDLHKNDIVSFENDLGYFEKKVIKIHHTEDHKASPPVFVKRLTEEEAYLHVYEHEITKVNPKSALPDKVKKYYVSLPGTSDGLIYDLDGKCFEKDFNQKMEELFASDKKLVSLIQQKDNRYYDRKFSMRANSKARVVLNLVKDYQPVTGESMAAD